MCVCLCVCVCVCVCVCLRVVSSACGCGRRLCDEVTGRCICPPQTVKPSCDVCDSQTFSFHPLLGCEGCDCSPTGVRPSGGLECDNVTGQCPWVEQACADESRGVKRQGFRFRDERLKSPSSCVRR